MILPRSENAPETFLPDYQEVGVGVRKPNNTFCQSLMHTFNGAITSTSANKSGMEPAKTVDEILAQLGEEANLIDLVIDAGELPPSKPSTVVGFVDGKLEVFREGAISREELETAITEVQPL